MTRPRLPSKIPIEASRHRLEQHHPQDVPPRRAQPPSRVLGWLFAALGRHAVDPFMAALTMGTSVHRKRRQP